LKKPSRGIDRRLARRRFERAAGTYAGASRVEGEVAARMLERLHYVKIAPRRIVDAGSGPARDARALRARYPGSSIIALDFALPMLPRAGFFGRLLRRAPLPVCADMTRMPFQESSIDLLWSNMALHWLDDPLAAFREWKRVLAPEGLLMFSTLGPDTLKELRAAAGAERVHAFIDMHDLGDMLLAAGFSAPVMDMEMLTLTYRDADALLADLRASGQTSARADRRRGLAGKGFSRRMRAALESSAAATFEVVYGHAWNAAPRAAREPAVKTIGIFRRLP
jgi:malonyl-CoA O-methyltransferase